MKAVCRSTTLLLLLALALVPGRGQAEGFEYAEDELPFSLNPLHESTMAETRINELLFEGLWAPGYDGTPVSRLADGYDLSPDRRSMTIYMRDDLTWSDGRGLTAKDVEFTIKAYQNPRTGSPDRSRLSFIKKVAVDGKLTVKVTFVNPELDPLEKFYFKILPEHRFSGPGVPRSDPFWFEPTTSGPFVVDSQDLGTWSLGRNPEALRSPNISSVKVREMPDKNQQVSSLGYGYIQAMVNVPAQSLPEVARSRNSDLSPSQSMCWWYLGMMVRQRDLTRLGVRKALAH
ncbi:MAG: ABC transporter substrate-binding protein, partial [Myxococcota bacterium]|nr:ABC transporter substrate-binding protein [Myxococcota bacterium]